MSWDFARILFGLMVVTGVVWFADVLVLRKRRRARAQAARDAIVSSSHGFAAYDETGHVRQEAYDKANRAPWWIEYGVSFFPVILFVFVLRSFLVEPFRIPSGSMMPTLQDGDLILVNKYTYGIRLPIVDRLVVPLGSPQRGDVVVFRYPVEPGIDYIKRVVGLPGDEIIYRNKTLFVNGQEVPETRAGDFFEPDQSQYIGRYNERLGAVEHQILVNKRGPQHLMPITQYPFRENCQYAANGIACKVPEGHYFMMGDNRDNSLDSRFWGFVPDRNIVGRAFFIWMNFSSPSRIGRFH